MRSSLDITVGVLSEAMYPKLMEESPIYFDNIKLPQKAKNYVYQNDNKISNMGFCVSINKTCS